jgi:tRNA (cytidine/uridine-2'-O-)-methyltransferase
MTAPLRTPRFHVVLFQPQIPNNTGNIGRTCMATGCRLHIVHPIGFQMDEKARRRAGLDYHELARVREHADFAACWRWLDENGAGRRYAVETGGTGRYDQVAFQPGDVLVFGAEGPGIAAEDLARFAPEDILQLPMIPGNRSVNLSNTVAIVAYEAWRQQAFSGA